MIEVEHLTKVFGNIKAVDDATFKVNKGEIVGFLGPNGAGKTTTMRILTGFIPQTSGTARVANFDVFTDSLNVRKRVGYLPENVPLYNEMVVENYLYFMAKIKNVPKEKTDEYIKTAIEEAGVGKVKKRLIGHLSKGFKQRVGLAQALLSKPEILIFDEPTVGLDPTQTLEIRELIRNLAGERTIMLSTHILPEVEQTCQRVIIINQGKIIAEDTPENLGKRLRGSELIKVTAKGSKGEILSKLKGLPDVKNASIVQEKNGELTFEVESEPNKEIRPVIAKAIIENGWDLLELQTSGLTLEEIFVRLTTEEEGN